MRFGVDVGGTTVKLGVFEGKELIDSFSITTTKETLFDDIKDAIELLYHMIINIIHVTKID